MTPGRKPPCVTLVERGAERAGRLIEVPGFALGHARSRRQVSHVGCLLKRCAHPSDNDNMPCLHPVGLAQQYHRMCLTTGTMSHWHPSALRQLKTRARIRERMYANKRHPNARAERATNGTLVGYLRTTGISVSGSLSLASLSKTVARPSGSCLVTSSFLVLCTIHSFGV